MFGKHFSLGVGVEMPKVSYTRTLPKEDADIIIGNIEQKMWNVFQIIPDIPLYGQCAWGDRGQIRLSSMIRSIRYYNIAEDKNNYVVGWGLKLTGTVKLGPVKLYGMAHGGHAIANYFAGNKNCDIDLVPTPDSDVTGKLVGTYSLGTIIGVEYNFTPRIFSTLKGSYLRNFIPEYHVDATKNFEDNTLSGQNYSINFIWRISSIFNAGIEYNHVRKTYETHKTLFDNRVYAMFMMTF